MTARWTMRQGDLQISGGLSPSATRHHMPAADAIHDRICHLLTVIELYVVAVIHKAAFDQHGRSLRILHADGRTACGAIGFIRESTEARRVKDAVAWMLRQQGHKAAFDQHGRSLRILQHVKAFAVLHAAVAEAKPGDGAGSS